MGILNGITAGIRRRRRVRNICRMCSGIKHEAGTAPPERKAELRRQLDEIIETYQDDIDPVITSAIRFLADVRAGLQ